MAEKVKKQEKEQVYLVPITWTMTGHYAIKATSAEDAFKKADKLALPDDGAYLEDSFEAFKDEIVPITAEFAHLKVHE